MNCPVLSRMQDNNESLTRVYWLYLGMLLQVIFFLMVLLAAVAELLVAAAVDRKVDGTGPNVKGRLGLFFRLEIIKKVVMFPLLILAIPYGVMAICLVPVIHELLDLALGTYCVRNKLGMSEAQPLRDYGYYLPLAILSCLPACLLCHSGLSPWISLPVAILSAFGIYYLILRRNENMKELVYIVRKELF